MNKLPGTRKKLSLLDLMCKDIKTKGVRLKIEIFNQQVCA